MFATAYWAENDGAQPFNRSCSFTERIPSQSLSIAEPLRPMYRYPAMVFADLELSRRFERAEGQACLEFAESRHRLDPASGAAWMQCAGANVVFDGVDSPVLKPSASDSLSR